MYITPVELAARYPAVSKPHLVMAYGDALLVIQAFRSNGSSLVYLRAAENWLGR